MAECAVDQDVVHVLHGDGWDTGVDMAKLAQTGDCLVAIGMQWVVPDKVPYTSHIFPDTFMRGAVFSAGLICMAIAPRRIPNLLRVRATHFVVHLQYNLVCISTVYCDEDNLQE